MSEHAPDTCAKETPHKAAIKLRKWLAAGARGRLVLTKNDFADDKFSLTTLLFSGSPRERLAQHWRSFCSYMGGCTPFTRWKEFWFRRAGVSIGKMVYFSSGTEIDLLFPQLVTLEDEAVTGIGALIVAHIYTPDRIVVGRATVKRGGLVGGRAVLGATSIGEDGVLGANSYSVTPVPAGHIAIGVPAVCRKRKSKNCRKEKDDDRP